MNPTAYSLKCVVHAKKRTGLNEILWNANHSKCASGVSAPLHKLQK